jgi:5'-deoxynucleotidase YfbR-like HD superfamily hydrolase
MSTPTRPDETPMIVTASGRIYNILKPDPSELVLSDVVIGMSRAERWSGQLGKAAGSFTVLEHSLHVVSILRALKVKGRGTLYAGLMHDAHEGIVGDMARPFKVAMRMLTQGDDYSVWDVVEDAAEQAVASRFKVPNPLPTKVKEADLLAQRIEGHVFFGRELPEECLGLPHPKRYDSDDKAIRAFMRQFRELSPERVS